MTSSLAASQPLPVISTLGMAVDLAKRNAGKSILLCLMFAAILIAAMAVPLLVAFAVAAGSGGAAPSGAMLIVGAIAAIAAFLAIFVIALWGQLSLLGVTLVSGIRDGGMRMAMRQGWSALPGFITATLALWAIMLGAGAIGLVLALVLDSIAVSVLLYLAWFALVIALLPVAMLAAPVAVDGGGVGSLGKARRLARGNGWRILGLLLLLQLASMATVMVIGMASMALIFVLGAIAESLALLGMVIYALAVLVAYVGIALVSVSTPAAAYLTLSGQDRQQPEPALGAAPSAPISPLDPPPLW